jgi:hypothetical protein
MSGRREQHEPDELDLDAEVVDDLEVDDAGADQVRGGYTGACAQQTQCCTASTPQTK